MNVDNSMKNRETALVNILVVEDDEFAMENILIAFDNDDWNLAPVGTAQQALNKLDQQEFDLLITDVKLPGMNGISLVEECIRRGREMKYIVITGYADEDSVIRALQLGVSEFLKKPYRNHELRAAVQRQLDTLSLERENKRLHQRLERENAVLRDQVRQVDGDASQSGIVGTSPAMLQNIRQADKVAQFAVNALINGESGTGKEVFAQYIHRTGLRSGGPFIPVNCAALSASLIESELFGYEKGAFTGANQARAGLFEAADGGILFLDEVTELPFDLQAKLLRSLETQTIRRLGGSELIKVDVQVLSACNRDIPEAIEQKQFREDLYHRLATVELTLQPLRERMEDFDLLLNHFVARLQPRYKIPFPPVPADINERLKSLPWRGNVRQLVNFVNKWYLFGDSATLADIDRWLGADQDQDDGASLKSWMRFDFVEGNMRELELAKEALLRKALQEAGGNKSKTARRLGISYQGLLKMLKKIDPVDQDV